MGYDRDDDSGDSRFRGHSLVNARNVRFHTVGGEPLSYVENLEKSGHDPYGEPVFKKLSRSRDLRPPAGAPYIPSYQRQVTQINKGASKSQLWQLEAKRRMEASADPERIARRAQTAGHSMQAQAVPVIRTSDLLPVKRPKPKVVRSFKNASELKDGPDNVPNPGVCRYVGS